MSNSAWYYEYIILEDINRKLARETNSCRKRILHHEQQKLNALIDSSRTQMIAKTYGGNGIVKYTDRCENRKQRLCNRAGVQIAKEQKLPKIAPKSVVAHSAPWRKPVHISWSNKDRCNVSIKSHDKGSSLTEENKVTWPQVKMKVVGEMFRGKHYYDGDRLRRLTFYPVRDSNLTPSKSRQDIASSDTYEEVRNNRYT